MHSTNRQWQLKTRPVGMVKPEHFELVAAPMPQADLEAGQVLIKTLMLGFDPAMRAWLMDEPSYLPPVAIGRPMRASGIGQVVQSKNAALPKGTLVQGLLNWQEFSIGDPGGPIAPTPLPADTSPEMALGILGATSLTAYFGLLDVGRPKAGDTVLVSGAAGATGSVAAQIARIKGCRTVGIAGGEEKCHWLSKDCNLDAVIDYKTGHLQQRIGELCPQGIDVFFDNVGGDTLEAGLEHMADFGRIVLCGAISGYNDAVPQAGPRNLTRIITRRLRMEGFIVLDYLDRAGEALQQLRGWVDAGEIASRVDMQAGFDNIPATLQRLFDGRNSGKQLLKLADPE